MQNLEVTDTLIGSGTAIEKGALISCHYEGFLEDGTKFDSSKDRGRPLEFVVGVGRVIKGWDMGLMGMQVGGKRTLHIPAHLAYGDRQVGEHILPNSNLIFHIELLDVRLRE